MMAMKKTKQKRQGCEKQTEEDKLKKTRKEKGKTVFKRTEEG